MAARETAARDTEEPPQATLSLARDTVLIIAPPDDVHADGVAAILRRMGVHPLRVDLGDFPAALQISLEFPELEGSYIRTTSGESVWLRNLLSFWWRRPRQPAIDPAVLGKTERQFSRINSQHCIDSFASIVDCLVVNDIWAQRRAERKAYQLRHATSLGLLIPQTIVTNDPGAVAATAGRGKCLVYKSLEKVVGAADGTKPFTEDDLARLDQLKFAPVIFQEFVEPGYDLRLTYVAGEIFTAKLVSEFPETRYDIRLDLHPTITPYDLDEEIEKKIRSLMKNLGLVFGTIDMRVDADGNHFFLEVNPAGQWIYVELQTHQPITEKVASILADPARGQSQ